MSKKQSKSTKKVTKKVRKVAKRKVTKSQTKQEFILPTTSSTPLIDGTVPMNLQMSSLSMCCIAQDEEEPIKWYLESCKHTYSILKDNLKEIVIVDGGSKDNTINIIKDYQKELPIVLLERPFDYPRDQMNFGSDHCSGDFIFSADADMTWTMNFSDKVLSGYFETYRMWDFILMFTARDAYHYFKNWSLGPNIRLYRKEIRWRQDKKFHVGLEGQHPGIPVCEGIMVFENSCRIKSETALLWRGERRQIHDKEMREEGGPPGAPDRFFNASKAFDSEIGLIADYSKQVAELILPSTNG